MESNVEPNGTQQGTPDKMAEFEQRLKDMEAQKDRGFQKFKFEKESEIKEMRSKYEDTISQLSTKLSDIEKRMEKPLEKPVLDLSEDLPPEVIRYLKDTNDYHEKRISQATEYAKSVEERINKRDMESHQAELNRQAKEQTLKGLVDAGATEDEARKYMQFFFSPESVTPEALVKMGRAWYSNPNSDNFDRRKEQSKYATPPVGATTSESLTDRDRANMQKLNIQDPKIYLELKEKYKDNPRMR